MWLEVGECDDWGGEEGGKRDEGWPVVHRLPRWLDVDHRTPGTHVAMTMPFTLAVGPRLLVEFRWPSSC